MKRHLCFIRRWYCSQLVLIGCLNCTSTESRWLVPEFGTVKDWKVNSWGPINNKWKNMQYYWSIMMECVRGRANKLSIFCTSFWNYVCLTENRTPETTTSCLSFSHFPRVLNFSCFLWAASLFRCSFNEVVRLFWALKLTFLLNLQINNRIRRSGT